MGMAAAKRPRTTRTSAGRAAAPAAKSASRPRKSPAARPAAPPEEAAAPQVAVVPVPEAPARPASAIPVCDFGRHAGEPYDRIPETYLNWMVRARHSKAALATAELARRSIAPAPAAKAPKSPPPVAAAVRVAISGEAVDALSKHCLQIWDETRFTAEGLYTWAQREGAVALAKAETDDLGRYRHLGMLWTFAAEGEKRMLKTAAPEVRRNMVDWNAKVKAGAATHRRALEAGRGKL
jgi:hypothetical protein